MPRVLVAAILCLTALLASRAAAQTLRVVTYNIQADTGGAVGQIGGPDAGPGLSTVLQAIGNEHLNGNAQPIDVLALQELYETPATTLQFIVTQLNNAYGAGTYAYDTTTDATTGNSLTGNGPSGLIYNTKTVKDLGAVQIGTASSSGAPRAPMRYTLEPVGTGSAADLYLYVSHAKSGTTSSDKTRRNDEAIDIRADASTLGANAHIIYAGDWNLTSSSETAYKTLVGGAAIGQASDPVSPGKNWTDATVANMTESATNLSYRDDLQLVTGPVLSQYGMQLVTGTYTPFGNNGSLSSGDSVSMGSNTALGDLTNRTAVLTALTTATDHLPLVADYHFLALPGDVNFDGAVNGLDVSAVGANWLASGTGTVGDANGDGVVNGLDLAVIAGDWLHTSAESPGGGGLALAPEPPGAILAAVGVVVYALRTFLRSHQYRGTNAIRL